MSGKKIKKDLRDKELHPTRTTTHEDEDGTIHTFTYEVDTPYENKRLYWKNKPVQRKRDNPNTYKGEKPSVGASLRNIRVPSKKRKTAMKRFKKAFPQFGVDKHNKPYLKDGS